MDSSESADRISILPDGVLSHILSFVPTEDSVRTRSLSTRWKHVFSLVPVLDFSYPSSTNPYKSSDLTAFLDFVDWVFNSYNVVQNLESLRFRIVCDNEEPHSRLPSWISKSILRRLQKFVYDVSFHVPQTLPAGIFTSESITSLELHHDVNDMNDHLIVHVPDHVCLPHLKNLKLSHIDFIDADSFRRLLRSCHVLEKLVFGSCSMQQDIKNFDIFVPSLKILDISHIMFDYEPHFKLDLPNVENFLCHGWLESGSYSFQGFKLLVEAYITFRAEQYEGHKALDNIVKAVSNAQKLSFSWLILETFDSLEFKSFGSPLPLFCNLSRMEIRHYSELSTLILDLLDKTPCLEILAVNNESYYPQECAGSSVDFHFSSERVPACVSLSLKEVRFEGFLMLDIEFKFVKYLLENAKVLDTLKIWSRGCLEKQFQMSLKLLTFSRWSRACQIVVKPDMNKI